MKRFKSSGAAPANAPAPATSSQRPKLGGTQDAASKCGAAAAGRPARPAIMLTAAQPPGAAASRAQSASTASETSSVACEQESAASPRSALVPDEVEPAPILPAMERTVDCLGGRSGGGTCDDDKSSSYVEQRQRESASLKRSFEEILGHAEQRFSCSLRQIAAIQGELERFLERQVHAVHQQFEENDRQEASQLAVIEARQGTVEEAFGQTQGTASELDGLCRRTFPWLRGQQSGSGPTSRAGQSL